MNTATGAAGRYEGWELVVDVWNLFDIVRICRSEHSPNGADRDLAVTVTNSP